MQDKDYIAVLKQSLVKKLHILEQLIEKNCVQRELLGDPELEPDELQKNIDEKATLIDELSAIDEGFELVYERVREELQANRSAYTAEIAQMLDSLRSACAEEARLSEARCSQLIHRLLCLLLLDETTESTAGGDRIAQAIRYMNRHLFEPIGVQDAAAAVSLSPSHFSRQFKARTGYSPYEYIVLRRIDKAKYMLASTELSVKEIAYATGYNSEENFIHSFRKNVGVAPGIFRKYPV